MILQHRMQRHDSEGEVGLTRRSPVVSIVLPTYNRAATLERAIESVLKQTFTDFELILIDDRSADDTRLILNKCAGLSNVRTASQLRRGCSVARNIGISIAQGRYVAFQDSDDEWVPDKLAKAVAALEGTGPETGVFYSDMSRVEADGSSADLRSPDVGKALLSSPRHARIRNEVFQILRRRGVRWRTA